MRKFKKIFFITIFIFLLLIILAIKVNKIISQIRLSASINRKWHLKTLPKEVAKEPSEFSVKVKSWQQREGLEVNYQVKNTSVSGKMDKIYEGRFKTKIDISRLKVGKHFIYAYTHVNNQLVISPDVIFYVSEPVCVSWNIDWEGWQVPETHLHSIEEQVKRHHNIPLTHFFNPRIFLESAVEATEAAYLTDWVKGRNILYNEEIQLHMHMHLDLVQAAGLVSKTWPKWGLLTEEPGEGYDVFTTAYSYEEFTRLLAWAKEQFKENGLPTPTGYRAGGWFADLEILKALQDNGFKYDASGREREIWDLEEIESPWDLKSTTQPYYPSLTDQNKGGFEHFDLLEIPNNGGDTYGYTAEELIQRFYDNFDKKPTPIKKAVAFLSHTQWQDDDEPIIEEVLKTTDKYLYKDDNGPVIYTTLGQIYQLWK